jgi:cell division septum initiation protein DivIVA
MQSDMKNILDDLETSIQGANKVPGIGNKAMVDIKKLKSIYDTLSQSIPEEILEASEVIKQKESIINQAYLEAKRTKEIAQQESASINDKARGEYDQKVSDSEVTRGAELKSEEIISEANAKATGIVQESQTEAGQIVDKAQTEATQRKDGADQYSKEVLFNIEERLSQVLGQVRRGIDALGDETQQEEQLQVSVNGTSSK